MCVDVPLYQYMETSSSTSASPLVSVYCSRDYQESYRFSTPFNAIASSLRNALIELDVEMGFADEISRKPDGKLLSEGFGYHGKSPNGQTVIVHISLVHELLETRLAKTLGDLKPFEEVFATDSSKEAFVSDGGWVAPGS